MEAVDLVPLRAAVLCANCEFISAQKDAGRCAACGSSAVFFLSRVLGSLEGLLPSTAEARNSDARTQSRLIRWPVPGLASVQPARYYSEPRTKLAR